MATRQIAQMLSMAFIEGIDYAVQTKIKAQPQRTIGFASTIKKTEVN